MYPRGLRRRPRSRRMRFVRAACSRRAFRPYAIAVSLLPRTKSNGSTLAQVAQRPPSRTGA
jgi:hypothetical protein